MKIKSLNANQTEVSLSNDTVVFVSYETPVAAYVPEKGIVVTDKKYSKTTSKHINQWVGGAQTVTLPQSFFDELI